MRNERSAPLVIELETWLREQRAKLSRKSETGKAIDYSLKRWKVLARYLDDGCPVDVEYGEAAAKALPHAVQLADRWRLMENASAAFLDAVRKSMRSIRAAIGAARVDPDLLTCAERLQYEGYLRREETNAAITWLDGEGVSIKEIVRRSGHSRQMCSGFGRVRSMHSCPCWMSCGLRAAAMEPNSGDA